MLRKYGQTALKSKAKRKGALRPLRVDGAGFGFPAEKGISQFHDVCVSKGENDTQFAKVSKKNVPVRLPWFLESPKLSELSRIFTIVDFFPALVAEKSSIKINRPEE